MNLAAVISPFISYGLAVAGGVAIGAAGAGWFQQTRVENRNNEIARMNNAAVAAGLRAEREADAASNLIAGLSTDLAQAHRHQRTIHVETVREIEIVTRPDRACLGPDAVRVLQRAQARRAAEGSHPGEPAGSGLRLAPDSRGSASERAIAGWMEDALDQYVTVRDRHRALAAAVPKLPCVEIVPGQ